VGSIPLPSLSEMYEVSRKTIYKWVRRYESEGPLGLEERSAAPRSHPNATPPGTAREIVATRLRHRKWGPKKVIAWLEEHRPGERWPAVSTAGEILKREGLVLPRRKRRRTPPYTEPFIECNRPDAVWSADFKGQFKTGDGKPCYPLTMTDNKSRYLLCCRGLNRPTFEQTKPWFEWAFKEYGLPEAIRTDNGAPFASVGSGGLTRLSVWFIKLGIRPERIELGHPEQNGRHERMHRSLKESTANPPRGDIKLQQVAAEIPKIEYGHDVIVRKVRHNGEIKWKGKLIYVSEALAGEPIALKRKDEHHWEINFGFYPLGVLNELVGRIIPLPGKQRRELLPMCPV